MPIYRNVLVDKMDELRDVSVQAERVYLRLACGRFSSRTGLVKYHPRDLAAEARVRPSELEAALAELAQAGHVLRADNAPAVYLLGFCSAFAPRPVDNRLSWVAEIDGFKYANLALQARKEIEDATGTAYPVATRRPPGGYPVAPLQEQEQEQEQNKNTTPTPAVSVPAVAEPQALDLKAQKVSKAKPKGPPRSHAIGTQLAAWWNGSLADRGNVECLHDRQWLSRYGKVAEAAACAMGDAEQVAYLMAWALDNDNYHAGRLPKGQRRTWRLEQWLAREHLEVMHAEAVRSGYPVVKSLDWTNRNLKGENHEAEHTAPVEQAAGTTDRPARRLAAV